MKQSRKIKRERVDPVVRQARAVGVPEAQIRNGGLVVCDVVDFSAADSRRTQRSGDRLTVRRKPKLDQLYDARIIDRRQLAACQWYHDAHSMRYDTTGITANYGDGGHGGNPKRDHLPSTKAQEEAFRNFDWAREGITPSVRQVFERVVLEGYAIGRLGFMFHLALNQLMNRIEGKVELQG